MHTHPLHILLADDDEDDRMLFSAALQELPVEAKLVTARDGMELMDHLLKSDAVLPDMLFLDLNMPRKKGAECLTEIKHHEKLKRIPVIIYSTSFNPETVDWLYKHGASSYICKPSEFSKIKKVILQAVTAIAASKSAQPAKEHFVIQV